MFCSLDNTADKTIINALLAQLVEHLTLNQGVQGSNPWRRIKYRFWRHMSSGVGAFFVFQLTRPCSLEESRACTRIFQIARRARKNKLT